MRERTDKPKIKKMKKAKSFKVSNIAFMLVSFILTLGVFAVLIFLTNKYSGKVVYVSVVKAIRDVPENLIITEENVDKYFALGNIDALDSIPDMITDKTVLYNQRTKVSFVAREVATKKDFDNLNEHLDKIRNPVEIGLEFASVANAAGGDVREGDLINLSIFYIDPATKKNVPTYVMKDIYVSKAMDNSGTAIETTDKETAAKSFKIIIEQDDEFTITEALGNASFIRLSKVLPTRLYQETEE